VLAGGLHPALGQLLLGLVLGDAGRLVDQRAPVLGPRRDDEADAPLLDDGVGLRAHAGAEEEVDDVAQAADHAAEEVLALAAAVEAARHHHLRWAGRAPGHPSGLGGPGHVVRVKRQRDLGQACRAPRLGAGEDDVVHGAAAQVLGGLLAHHPADGVHDVRLAAPIGADHGGDRIGEGEDGPVDERLEPADFEPFDPHACSGRPSMT
jgi:hypothetical protein